MARRAVPMARSPAGAAARSFRRSATPHRLIRRGHLGRGGLVLLQRLRIAPHGPLLDRLDLQVVVKRLEAAELSPSRQRTGQAAPPRPDSSVTVAARVLAARQRMQGRNPAGLGNGQLVGEALLEQSLLSREAEELWQRAIAQRRLSARGAERVLRVARTIADLDGQAAVGTQAIAEALTYRSFDQAL